MITALPVEVIDGAVCAQTDPETFFPERGTSTSHAKDLCFVCPVRIECLAWALEHNERFGVWGGLDEKERRRIRVRSAAVEAPQTVPKPTRQPREPVVCGTRRGYHRHRSKGEPACDPCRHANAAADRRLRQTGSTLPAA